MSRTAQYLLRTFYEPAKHPNRILEAEVDRLITPQSVLLDAGCGRSTPVLARYVGRVARLVGVDLVDFVDVPEGIETHQCDLASIPLPDESVDVILSRSVFEHLTDPAPVYRELARVLRPGGQLIFLTANMWDYGTFVARIVPNKSHARIVKWVEGRDEQDTFPTAYKTNRRRDVERFAAGAGLQLRRFEYLSQYPNYFLFNGALFFLGMCYEKVISRFDALAFLRGWILVTLQKPDGPAASRDAVAGTGSATQPVPDSRGGSPDPVGG